MENNIKTIKDLVDYLLSIVDEEDYKFIQNNTPSSIHFSNGMALRNKFNLWDKNCLIVQDAIKTYDIAHADDISGLIYDWLWAIIQKKEFDPIKHCEIYHKHWKQFGMTSLEAGGIK